MLPVRVRVGSHYPCSQVVDTACEHGQCVTTLRVMKWNQSLYCSAVFIGFHCLSPSTCSVSLVGWGLMALLTQIRSYRAWFCIVNQQQLLLFPFFSQKLFKGHINLFWINIPLPLSYHQTRCNIIIYVYISMVTTAISLCLSFRCTPSL